MEFNCPNCGAPVRFQNGASIFVVCAYCHSSLLRRRDGIERLGEVALLASDTSSLQLGASGDFGREHFALIGRLTQDWGDGQWHEWHALFDSGRTGWLAEAQGFYMMSFLASEVSALPKASEISPGLDIVINNKHFQVDDIKKARCVFVEGELPFAAPVGREAVSVDLSSSGNGFACLDYSAEGVSAYIGQYVEFEDFHFKNLKTFDGW